jgi:cell wall-associated NlpC family hydrolase
VSAGAPAPRTLVVRAAIAPLHAEARVSSAQVSQRLAGHPLAVLEESGDWLRVRGHDGYEGWAHRGYLAEDAAAPEEIRLLSLGCSAARPGGVPRLLPLGAWLSRDERVTGGETVEAERVAGLFPREAAAICATAVHRFAGTSYQWGGVTPWGADCSGFVQTVFWLHGIRLPRDAWQQALEGDDAGNDPLALRAADLLFFSDRDDRRITHVGIALGDRRMVHLALGRGGYAIERLEDRRDAYVGALRERFVGARTVLR